MLSSIRARLTFSHLAVIVLAMGLSGLLLLSSLERYFLDAMEDSLAAQARITAQALIPGAQIAELSPAPAMQNSAYNTVQQSRLGDGVSLQAQNVAPPAAAVPLSDFDLGYLSDASLQLSTQLDTRIRIVDTTGTVLVDSGQSDQGASLAADPLVAQALRGEYARRTDRDGGRSVRAMHLALPVLIDDQLVGVVYLSQPLRDVTAVLADLRARWLLSTAIALVLSAVLGLALSRAIARPVRRLTEAAGAVAQGRLDQQVPVRAARHPDELGRLSRAFNDMTARLRAARQTQVDFVANVSHELRTPLTSLKGLVETLRGGAVDDPEVRDRFLGTMEDETDRLIRLVRDLLLLSRADSEALDLQREPLDVGPLAQAVAGRLASQARTAGLSVQVDVDPNCPPAWADPDRVEQVLVNLVDNALKYSKPGGAVSLHVGPGPGSPPGVRVQVRDQGIGIPAEHLARIGERFYRADKARDRAAGGSGLGLAIARALVEAHGGQMAVDSAEGQGTTVSFTLPAAR